ncbi:PTS lactose/cellobiose transporter subunit IIA [Oceanobacillus chungangensis]|uniref:PTS cellobiose transporter subunit IIA n=1 Tax=Oceanobacillus chungangensis TaxID=1229152 RepID=A0A3D8Q127_9BACI|nr:PTS lactose/cellobiose transporter subunit IIA [Oceanobacillus chungangensis]RDW20705.1 PTS cellobiose transporter subunit IIA [Oceanobacillus chungangensis]
MTKDELYNISFQLILHSGNARSSAIEAIYEAKKKNFEAARQKITESDKELNQAHTFQIKLIQEEAQGENFDIPIILVHAQDHFMTALTLKELANEIIDLRQEMIHLINN